MAETKIKVNELPSATPTLNDTLLGSNATKEYACKVEDLLALGGGGGVSVINSVEHDGAFCLNKTWQEIHDFIENGSIVFAIQDVAGDGTAFSIEFVVGVAVDDAGPTYEVDTIRVYESTVYVGVYLCDSADNYPFFD